VSHIPTTVNRKQAAALDADLARIFLNEVLPVVPDVPVPMAHLSGAGSYDHPLVDQALAVFVDAIADHDRRMTHVYFDVSGVVGCGNRTEKASLIATRIRQIGVTRVLYGSGGAAGGNLAPGEAWTAFRQFPLSDAEFHAIANNIAPYVRRLIPTPATPPITSGFERFP
jgi:uncharacterized protein